MNLVRTPPPPALSRSPPATEPRHRPRLGGLREALACRGIVTWVSSQAFAGFVTTGRTLPLEWFAHSQRHGTRCERDIGENNCRLPPRHYNAPMSLVISAEFAAGLTASLQI